VTPVLPITGKKKGNAARSKASKATFAHDESQVKVV
jgi:hypothetical protein